MVIKIEEGDCVKVLSGMSDDSFDASIFSPPYYKKLCYSHPDQHGLEPTLKAYLQQQKQFLAALYRVMQKGSAAYVVIGYTMSNYSPYRNMEQGRSRLHGDWQGRRKPEPGWAEKELIDVPSFYAEVARSVGWRLRMRMTWDKEQARISQNSDTAALSEEVILHLVKPEKNGRFHSNTRGFPRSVFRYRPESDPEIKCPLPWGLLKELLGSFMEPTNFIDPYAGSGRVLKLCSEIGLDATGIDVRPISHTRDFLNQQNARHQKNSVH